MGACTQPFGRSRGRFTSKVHFHSDNQGLPIGFILTGGEASDYNVVDDFMALPLPKPKALLANKGYDGERFRKNLLMRGILLIIPPRSNRKVPVHPDYRRCKDRNPHRAHVQQAETATLHCHPLRQDCPVV
nr:transposase [Blastomonas fulva]